MKRVVQIVGPVLLLGLILSVRLCGRTPSPPAAKSAETKSAQPVEPRQFMVRALVLNIDRAGVESAAGQRLLAAIDGSGGGVGRLADDVLAQIRSDEALLEAAGQAAVVSRPTMMILGGQPATIEIMASSHGGVSTPRKTRTATLEVLCTVGPEGGIEGGYQLREIEQSGAVEHAAADAGIPLGDRALIRLEGLSPSGTTLVGVHELVPGNDLGGALVLFVTPVLIQSDTDDDSP